MSEQLSFDLTANTSQMVTSIKDGFGQVNAQVKQLKTNIDTTLGKTVQMKLDLDAATAIANSEKLAKAQDKVALAAKKTERSTQLQKQFANSVKVSAQQLLKAKANLEKLLQSKKKNSQEARKLVLEIEKINGRLQQMKAPSGLSGMFGGLVGKLTLAGTAANLATQGINKLVSGIGNVAQTGANIEVLKLQLDAFTGSTSKSSEVFSNFLNIAAKTPFDLMQVAQAGKTMMAFGIEADKAVRITEQLSIVAGATGGELNNLSRNMGQIAAQGQAYTRDLTQFAMQGIPIWEEMSRVTGASVSELKKMAAEGKISFDVVEQALSNMTAKGTAFQQVGERIGDTWIGKMAQIESGVQNFAGAFVEAITNLDSALGGVLKGSLQALADGFNHVAENANNFVAAMAGIGAGLTAIGIGTFIQQVMNGFLPALRTIVKIKKTWAKITKGLVAAQMALKAMMGPVGWASIAIGVGVAAAAYGGLSAMMDEAEKESDALKDSQMEALKEAQDTSTALGMTYEEAAKKFKGATEEKIALLKEEEAKKADLIRQQTELQQTYKDDVAAAKKRFAEIKATFTSEKNAINETIRALQAKKNALNVMGPAARKLAALSEKELRYTARTGRELKGHISDRERAKLEAQKQLEVLNQQKAQAEIQKRIDAEREELTALQLQHARDKEGHDAEIAKLTAEQKDSMDGVKTALDNSKGAIDKLVKAMTGGLPKAMKQTRDDAGKIGPAVATSQEPLDNAGTAADTLASNLGDAVSNANDLATAIRNIPPIPTVPKPAFAGGPVSGGEMRTVNELGKEAFLSASGKLSMINAPAWGEWRAPSSGTIIPAHLTKQLDIPTGGINLNKSPGANANVGRAVRTVQGAMGDVFNQNVTVQAANPVQAANNIMVEMTRLKRRKFR